MAGAGSNIPRVDNPDLHIIHVPPTWLGRTQETADRRLVWTCAACSTVDICAHDRLCREARRQGGPEIPPDGPPVR